MYMQNLGIIFKVTNEISA